MAIGLENFPNITPSDTDYPSGRIKDDTGSNDGTPIDLLTNGDLQEFFAKLMRLASITPNGIPDNEYSGHQYIQALISAINTNNTAGVIETNIGGIVKTRIIQIGIWDMDNNAAITVSHGLPDITKIVSITAQIIADGGASVQPINRIFDPTNTTPQGGIRFVNASTVSLGRLGSGIYDSPSFSSTAINRGYIHISYIV